MWPAPAAAPYVQSMIETNAEVSTAAAAELAAESQQAFDQALDATVEHAQGRSVTEVDALLRVELRRRGIEPEDTTRVAAQIVAALDPVRPSDFNNPG